MDLSKRLQTIISLVEPGEMIADIGTDQGYVPIALVRRGICRKGLAMDVGNGPLERAREHIHAHSMENVIETRLSDGLHMLQPGEADRIVIAGMGGPLMQRILEEGEAAARAAGQLILSPHSGLREFRRFLTENHYYIQNEAMLREDGKDYTILIVHDGEPEVYDESDYTYGKRIREEDIPVKIDYLKREIALRESLLDKLHAKNTEKAAIRREELTGELRLAQTARSRLLASEIEESGKK